LPGTSSGAITAPIAHRKASIAFAEVVSVGIAMKAIPPAGRRRYKTCWVVV
jgi:hypothetical protein